MILKNKKQYVLTTDWHYCHENIKKYCNRPDGFEKLIEINLLNVVSDLKVNKFHNIILIHLGDIYFGKCEYKAKNTLEYLRPYCDALWCIAGNHDTVNKCNRLGFDIVVKKNDYIEILNEPGYKNACLSHSPLIGKFNNIHGHQHNKWNHESKTILISQEFLDYRPITLEEVQSINDTPGWNPEKQKFEAYQNILKGK